eukprot:2913983-Heterocapsa_arctica.AAC.1
MEEGRRPTKKEQELHRTQKEAEKLGAAKEHRSKQAGAAKVERKPEVDRRSKPAHGPQPGSTKVGRATDARGVANQEELEGKHSAGVPRQEPQARRATREEELQAQLKEVDLHRQSLIMDLARQHAEKGKDEKKADRKVERKLPSVSSRSSRGNSSSYYTPEESPQSSPDFRSPRRKTRRAPRKDSRPRSRSPRRRKEDSGE